MDVESHPARGSTNTDIAEIFILLSIAIYDIALSPAFTIGSTCFTSVRLLTSFSLLNDCPFHVDLSLFPSLSCFNSSLLLPSFRFIPY